ncbi:hypothetical protein F5884DRAFT_848025 [Xylogone sp. PMI_703]|nr:hypothetical protein F5884DRAFT_848025 [Xylogone sp. PMI_703]
MAYPQRTFKRTTFQSPSYISRRREVVYSNTLLYQLKVLKETGRYDAFKLKWHSSYSDEPNVWPVPNHLFWDSDIAKWIEGACYFLMWNQNEEIDTAVKELVEMIRSASQEDGYLNIHFTVVEPSKRFTNLRDLHELYNAGHLIEAALAHNQLYNSDLLMEPIIKYVDLLCRTFGKGKDQKHGYPGHPEIELALLRLFAQTKEQKHLELARYFLEERGNPRGQDGIHYYDYEIQARGENPHMTPDYHPQSRSYWYYQAHKPITEQETIEGHSVRAMYLLTAVTDIVRMGSDSLGSKLSEYDNAVIRLWDNMVRKKMYMTGGIGSVKQWEGFGIDYHLPQGTDEGGCYAETCAAIGVMMFAERLLQLGLNGKYADIMEICFYNAVMTGMSCSGTQFTYVNQLASSDSDLSKRAEWFTCACCPPNVTRLLGYIGGYLWTFNQNEQEKSVEINVHMYDSANLSIPASSGGIEFQQRSNWPWDGEIDFTLNNTSDLSTVIRLRIPGWAEEWKLSPDIEGAKLDNGYLTIPPSWLNKNTQFRLSISLKPRFISPHPYTNQNTITIARGPIVYCVEDFDNSWVQDHFKSLCLDSNCRISERMVTDTEMREPYVEITAHDATSFVGVDDNQSPQLPQTAINFKGDPAIEKLIFIPYYLRSNRGGKGHMRVGLRKMTE